MKVLLINQIPEVNNKYTFSLAKSLRKEGADLRVCGIEDDDVSSFSMVPFINVFLNYSKGNNLFKKIVLYKKSWDRIVEYCTGNSIDIIHVQWYIFSPLDWIYHRHLKKRGIKIVTTIHDLLPFNKKIYDFYFHKKIYSQADMVINQAKVNEECLIKDFGVNANKIIYIPHGHYMDYAEPATQEESRKFLKLESNKKIILFFGQIKKVKGVDVLIKAMKQVVDKHEDVLCVIAGKVWKDDFSIYQNLINQLGIQQYFRTDIHYIEDSNIKYYFNAADIVVFPYRQIYQSGCILLAYAYGKPVIATSEGEFLTVVKDKETGLLVPSGDDSALSDAIEYYLNNMDIATKFGICGKDDLLIRLSWDNIASQVFNVYKDILSH